MSKSYKDEWRTYFFNLGVGVKCNKLKKNICHTFMCVTSVLDLKHYGCIKRWDIWKVCASYSNISTRLIAKHATLRNLLHTWHVHIHVFCFCCPVLKGFLNRKEYLEIPSTQSILHFERCFWSCALHVYPTHYSDKNKPPVDSLKE